MELFDQSTMIKQTTRVNLKPLKNIKIKPQQATIFSLNNLNQRQTLWKLWLSDFVFFSCVFVYLNFFLNKYIENLFENKMFVLVFCLFEEKTKKRTIFPIEYWMGTNGDIPTLIVSYS